MYNNITTTFYLQVKQKCPKQILTKLALLTTAYSVTTPDPDSRFTVHISDSDPSKQFGSESITK